MYKPSLGDHTLEILILKQRDGVWPVHLEFDWDGNRAQLSGGRELQLGASQTGEAVDDFLGSRGAPQARRKKGGR